MPEANEVVGKSSAFPRELRERFHTRLRVAHVLAAVALAGASLASEGAKAQTVFPPINVPGPSGGGWGDPFGGGGWGGGYDTDTSGGCGQDNCGEFDPMGGQVVNVVPAPVPTTCAVEHELRLGAANFAALNTRIGGRPLVWSARRGDYFVTIGADGKFETWEFLCGGVFCSGTVLQPSPRITQCPN